MAHPLFYRGPVDGYEMVLIPAGRALIGSSDSDSDAEGREKPQFEVELPDYYIGLGAVTNIQYAGFLSASRPSSSDLGKWILLDSDCHVKAEGGGYGVDDVGRHGDHPVVQVSWFGAEAYCAWSGLRLPSEIEWEKAARGPQGSRYPWGDEWDATKCRHSGNKGSERTCGVWDYPDGVSGYGVYNMSGNVLEWCSDWYDAAAYPRYARGDLTRPASGQYRVVRGGSWSCDGPSYLRAAYRYYGRDPSLRGSYYGFRCVRGL